MTFELDQPCGRRLRFRDLIECGSTFTGHAERYSAGLERAPIPNLPLRAETWEALRALAAEIIDPVEAEFGPVRLTYGFCSPTLERAIRRRAKREGRSPRICPRLDQHAGHEVRGDKRICERDGVAVDFEVSGTSSAVIARWIGEHIRADRLYLYGEDRPLHVSWAPAPAGLAYRMKHLPSGAWVPGRW